MQLKSNAMRLILLYLVCWSLFFVSPVFSQQQALESPEQVGISQVRLTRLQSYFEQQITEQKIAGAVALVARKGQVVEHAAWGNNNLEAGTPMAKDAIFYIQSMTKPIMTVAFMMLYEEGYFMLTDPVEKYLPAFKDREVVLDRSKGTDSETEPAKTPVTIAHLLSHTAGLSHGLGRTAIDRSYMMNLYGKKHETIEDRVNAMLELPLYGQPGEQWYYSAAPDVLALLIEKFSGQSVIDFLQKRIFEPLKMKDTGYNLSADQQKRIAALHYSKPDGGLAAAPPQSQPSPTGNTVFGGTHGLFSTASDYLQFCQMLLNGGQANGIQFLSPKTLELMTQNQVGDLYSSKGEGFGFGFGVVTDLAAYDHLGSVGQYYWSGAYCTYFFIDPKEEMIAILMTQTAPNTSFWGKKLRQLVYQSLVD
jgi:CubicO group peptidase (beta-lactamase class C family)